MAFKTWKFADGWAYIKNGKRGWSKTKPKNNSNSNRKTNKPKPKNRSVGRPMAKKKKTHRRSFLSFNNIAKFLRVGALVAPAAYAAITYKSPQEKLQKALYMYTGFNIANGNFNPSMLIQGYAPFLMTSLVTYGIPKLNGMIRRL